MAEIRNAAKIISVAISASLDEEDFLQAAGEVPIFTDKHPDDLILNHEDLYDIECQLFIRSSGAYRSCLAKGFQCLMRNRPRRINADFLIDINVRSG